MTHRSTIINDKLSTLLKTKVEASVVHFIKQKQMRGWTSLYWF